MSGKGYFKRTPRGGARSKQLVAGVRRGRPTRARTFKMARGLNNTSWKGGFDINRLGVTWCLNNAATSELVATADLGFTGSSVFNCGTPVLVSGALGGQEYNVPFSMDFTLDSLAQYSDIQSICDRYQIVKVEVKFWSPATSAQAVNAATAGSLAAVPRVHYVVDYDDVTVPTVQQVKEKMGLRSGAISQGKTTTVAVYPRVAPLVQSAGGTSFTVPAGPMFINTASANVQHFGLKGYLANCPLPASGASAGCTVIMVETKYYIRTRDLQ